VEGRQLHYHQQQCISVKFEAVRKTMVDVYF